MAERGWNESDGPVKTTTEGTCVAETIPFDDDVARRTYTAGSLIDSLRDLPPETLLGVNCSNDHFHPFLMLVPGPDFSSEADDHVYESVAFVVAPMRD